MSKIKDEKALLSKPGDTILETIEVVGMSQVELAERMGKTPGKINDLISGKVPVSVNTAMQLEKVLGIPMQFWLNRENLYREKLARIEEEEFLEECMGWLKVQPIKELKKMGYLKSENVDTAMAEEMLKFYGVVSPKQWESVYVEQYAGAAFRRSQKFGHSVSSLSAWLRMGEIGLQRIVLPEYSKEKFKSSLIEIKDLVKYHPEDFAYQLRNICTAAGVGLVFTPNLTKAAISGATRWFGGRPLIQITDRYKSNDQFWFTFFHEAGHILLHGKKEVFIEEFEGISNDLTKEEEANLFAGNWLLPDEFINEFNDGIEISDIRKVARKFNTHPAIVLGRLQKIKKVPYGFAEQLRVKVLLDQIINT